MVVGEGRAANRHIAGCVGYHEVGYRAASAAAEAVADHTVGDDPNTPGGTNSSVI